LPDQQCCRANATQARHRPDCAFGRWALGQKNFLFVGSDAGGETLADAMTVIETVKLSNLNPEAYLRDVL
jgi:hypothetical protein